MKVSVNPFSVTEAESTRCVIKSVLEEPFPPELIRQRKGSHGAMLDYIEGWSIIQRLNNAFNIDWSFTIQEWKIIDQDIIVLGRLSGKGIVKDAFGGSRVTLNKDTNKVIDLGADIKAAATDALKKCATLFGVGLHLYQKDEKAKTSQKPAEKPVEKPHLVDQPAPVDGNGKGNGDDKDGGNGNGDGGNGSGNGHGGNDGNGKARITAKQLAYVFSLAKDKKLDNGGIKNLALNRYNKTIEFLNKIEASEFITFLKSA